MQEYAYEQGMAEGEMRGEAKGIQKGILEARRDSILNLLEETGPVPEEFREKITEEINENVLKNWLKLAARAESIDEFLKEAVMAER